MFLTSILRYWYIGTLDTRDSTNFRPILSLILNFEGDPADITYTFTRHGELKKQLESNNGVKFLIVVRLLRSGSKQYPGIFGQY